MKKIFLLFCLICTTVSASNLPDYSRVLDLDRTIITFKDLKEIISIIKDYDNQLDWGQKGSLEVRISTGEDEVSFYSFEQVENMDLGNENYSNLDINYRSNYKSENNDISLVSIHLWYSNRVRITGSDNKKVNSFYLVLKDFFNSKEVFISSKTSVFVFIFIIYFFLMFYLTNKNLLKNDEENNSIKLLLIILLWVLIILPILFLDQIFPDFLLVPISKPWYEEYAWWLAILWVLSSALWIWSILPKKTGR